MKTFTKNLFDKKGYAIFNTKLNKNYKFNSIIKKIKKDLLIQLNRKNLNNLGGFIMGNLNVNQGNYGPKLFSLVFKKNLTKNLEKILGNKINTFDVLYGGNLSLPNKGKQLFHTDGSYSQDMYLVSFATEDITKRNGPTEICLGTSARPLKYWEFFISKKKKKMIFLKKGQVLVRKHNLWHRGTTNYSAKCRLLLSFILTPKKRNLKIAYYKKLTILPNFFSSNYKGKFHEIVYTYFEKIIIFFKLLLSIIKNK